MGCQIVMATRRGRLRGTSVPAGEQPPSQLLSFLSDTHLLYTDSESLPPLECSGTSVSVSPTQPKARIWLEKDQSFRACFSAISLRWESQ